MDEENLENRLFENGIVVIHSGLGNLEKDQLSDVLLRLMQYKTQPDKTVQLYITSSSDDYTSSMAVYDILQTMENPVAGFAIGSVDYYGTLILAACKKGQRYALKHTDIGIHQPVGFFSGVTTQSMAAIRANEASENRKAFEEALVKATGHSAEKIHEDVSKGLSLTAEEALEYGLIDHILD